MTRADLNTVHVWAGQTRISATDLVDRADGDAEMRKRLAAVAVAVARVRDLAEDRLREMTVVPLARKKVSP